MTLLLALGQSDCERIAEGLLAQPANALSSLAYAVVGSCLLVRAGRHHSRLAAGGIALVAVGAGSVAYHGPQPSWAEAAHDGSILVLVVGLVGEGIVYQRKPGAQPGALKGWSVPLLLLGAAGLAYAAGRTGSAWCYPDSPWQPHAAWHILTALAAGATLTRLARVRPSWRSGSGSR